MILLWVLTSGLSGQQLVHEEFGFAQGLGNNAINCLLEDRAGYVWAGTMSGLYRGDGERFTRFDAGSGLPDATVQSLAEDEAGRLWVATRTGVAWLERGRFQTVDFGLPVAIFGRRALAAGPGGRTWVATSQGLFEGSARGEGGFAFRRRAPPGLPAGGVDAVFLDSRGALWLSAGKRIWRVAGGTAEPWGPERGVPPDRWDDFAEDGRGGLWVRGASRLLHVDAGAVRAVDRTEGLPASGFFGSLARDQRGRLLVPTDNGLFVLDGARWRSYGVAQGLPGQSVSVAMQDREGSLWVGLWGLGLIRAAGYGFAETWTVRDGLGSSTVHAVLVDGEGRAWAGTDNGLAVLFPGQAQWKPVPMRTGHCGLKVRALAAGPGISFWTGCYPGGVAWIDPASGAAARLTGPDRVNGLLVDEQGFLWVASIEGLFRSAAPGRGGGARLARIRPPDESPGDVYFRMAKGRGGVVWVTSSAGLLRWRGGRWKRYGRAEGLREEALTHVTEDAEGGVWVAYRSPLGVTRLAIDDEGSVRGAEHYLERLSSPTTLLLRTDRSGRVWIGGDDGIDIRDGGRWRRFSKADGLAAHSCAVDAFHAARDGSVWIGTSRGVTRISSVAAATEPVRAVIPVVIPWVQAGSRRFEPYDGQPLRVDGSERSFAAGLAALTFRHRREVRFQYRLHGFDERWVDGGSREARYTVLPPGDYTFEIRARSLRDDLSFASARVAVEVLPPFWMTWWFRTLLLLAAAAGARRAWRWRTEALRQRQKLLEQMVRERTRQLRLEKEKTAEALRRAEEASRVKSDFLARMSHEIRTPMHGVIGTADLLLRSGLREDQEQLVRTLQQSAGLLLHLLNDILDLSKIEAGQLTLASRPFDLAQIVENVASLLRPVAQGKGLELRSKLPPGPMLFQGDPYRVGQILLNLVSNAVKFTSSGFVEIRVARPAEPGAPGFELAVQDTGCGIAPDQLERIFQPFVQAEGAAQLAASGTGLGLAIVKALTEAMGGRIRAESRQGEGSTFHVRLPLAAAELLPKEEQATAPEPEGRPLRVLVVEDNALNQTMVKRMLEALGHAAEVADDGHEALELGLREPFDAILMDIRLPGIDGLETARRLRQAGCRTPILALSANVYESDRAAAEAAGMDGFLGKPLHLEELRQALARIAARDLQSGAG